MFINIYIYTYISWSYQKETIISRLLTYDHVLKDMKCLFRQSIFRVPFTIVTKKFITILSSYIVYSRYVIRLDPNYKPLVNAINTQSILLYNVPTKVCLKINAFLNLLNKTNIFFHCKIDMIRLLCCK